VIDLILLTWIGFIFANRIVWSTKARSAKFKSRAQVLNFSSLATFGYLLYTTYLYSRTWYKGLNDSNCTLFGQISAFLYFIANFGIWMFYWQRHWSLSTTYHKRVKSFGLVLFTACLLAASALVIKYWRYVKNKKDGTCLIATKHRIGISGLYDDFVILMLIMVMDLICSTFISLSFIIPLWKLNRSIVSSDVGSPTNTWKRGAVKMEKTLRRVAMCSFVATFSTVVCIASSVVVNELVNNKNWADIAFFVDGVINVTAVHYSIAAEIRWSPFCCSRKSCKSIFMNNSEGDTFLLNVGTREESVSYARVGS